jgi:hypothetical protein
MNFQVGDMVTYRRTSRGGYGYQSDFPAIVTSITPSGSRVGIRLARIKNRITVPFDVFVSSKNLRRRDARCSFESILHQAEVTR